MDIDLLAEHPFISEYFRYIDNTETPKIMHLWAALSGLSACMGRRCWLPMGTGEIYPNMYVILCGPPALRKSTAFLIMTKLLRRFTNVRLAPDDTGGQRQGLIAAMLHVSGDEKDDDKEIIQALAKATERHAADPGGVNLSNLAGALDDLGGIDFDTRDPNTMYIAASELNSILGEGNTALLTFLQKMYDGDPYRYQLKTTQAELTNALLGLIGATTPSQLALALPPEAIGQGFTSRAIFVYADKKQSRKIPRPSLDKRAEEMIGEIFKHVYDKFEGAFAEAPEAAEHLDSIYMRGTSISDPRFVHYLDRRHTHLQKLSMVFAASRREQTIRKIDVDIADKVLLYTEQYMPEALGEYGMNKLSAAKQRLLDFLRNATDPIPITGLYAMLSRDMSQLDFKATLVELHNAGKVTQVNLPIIGKCIIAADGSGARKAKHELQTIESLMRRAN